MYACMDVHKHHMSNALSLHYKSLSKKLMNVQAIRATMRAPARIWLTNTLAHALLGIQGRTVRQVCAFLNFSIISNIAKRTNKKYDCGGFSTSVVQNTAAILKGYLIIRVMQSFTNS